MIMLIPFIIFLVTVIIALYDYAIGVYGRRKAVERICVDYKNKGWIIELSAFGKISVNPMPNPLGGPDERQLIKMIGQIKELQATAAKAMTRVITIIVTGFSMTILLMLIISQLAGQAE